VCRPKDEHEQAKIIRLTGDYGDPTVVVDDLPMLAANPMSDRVPLVYDPSKRSPASAESEASTTDSSKPESASSDNARSVPTGETCSEPGSPASPASPMSEKSPESESQRPSEPQTFDWQAGGTSDKSWRGKSRSWTEDKPGTARALTTTKTLAVYIPPETEVPMEEALFETDSLTLSPEDSPAKTSPSPANVPASKRGSAADSSSSSSELPTTLYGPEGMSSLRTYPDYFPALDEIRRAESTDQEGTSPSFSRRWPTSGFTTSPGECWTADTSECPNDGAEFSSLADVLEDSVAPKYYLSPRAAAGILRRAERRGRDLPRHLQQALEAVARPALETGDIPTDDELDELEELEGEILSEDE
jgi:hypothetical protein